MRREGGSEEGREGESEGGLIINITLTIICNPNN